MIAFPCPTCQYTLKAPEEKIGVRTKCSNCGSPVQVPGAPAPAIGVPARAIAAPPRQIAGTNPNSQIDRGAVQSVLNIAKWFALILAMALAVAAAAMPLAGAGDMVSYGLAAGAILVGLVAVGFAFVVRRSMLECAVTAVFLAVAGLLFSINIAVATVKSASAAQALSKAAAKEDQVTEERVKAEAAEKSAAEKLKKAEDAPAKAEAILKKAEESEAKAAEAPQKAAELLEQVKGEQAKLEKKRNQLAEKTDALALERTKVQDAKAKLDDLSQEVEASKKAAAVLAKKAEEDKLRGKTLLDAAEQKEKEAQALHKKVKDAVEGVKNKLKAEAPEQRKAAIAAIARIGDTAASADYDLCKIIAFDAVPELRRVALEALEKVQPKLHLLAVTLAMPPETTGGKGAGGYLGAIQQLPDFGRAGVPLIASQLQGKNPYLDRSHTTGMVVLKAHVEALSKIAREDQAALTLLRTIPESPLAVKTKQHKQIDGARLDAFLHTRIGEHLIALGKEKPETRKTIVPYLITLSQYPGQAKLKFVIQARLTAINALGAFGADAESALPTLNKMKLDPSEQVRNAARDAIAAIEKQDK